MNLANRKVLVVGTGISGIGAVKLLTAVGACPIVYDGNTELEIESIKDKLPKEKEIPVYLGEIPKEIRNTLALIVCSPGVPVDLPFLEGFRKEGIPVWGEIELAYRYSKGRILAVTGTNGKTTTTALLGQIMKDSFTSVYVVGNIGNPYTEIALQTTEDSVIVAEISSFQLETVDTFRPTISAILNITPDHLNRHHTMEQYVSTKERIAQNQGRGNTCVLNYEDFYTKALGEKTHAAVLYFSAKTPLKKGIYLENDVIYYGDGKSKLPLMNIHEMQLLGIHNVENVMAAIGMAYSLGIPFTNIIETVKQFRSVEHRIEYVATKKGVEYYNDSKGTNPDAAIKGIQAMRRPTYLIGGGYDKESCYDEWIKSFDGKVKSLILIGQTKDKIAQCAKAHGFSNVVLADTLEEAVEISRNKAVDGDAVLLSPACASWGMFPNYEVRGNHFKELVNQIKE